MDQVDALQPYAPGYIFTADLSAIVGPGQDGGALTFAASSSYGACVYDVQSGYFVVASADTHVQTQQLTNLTGVAIPGNQQPLPPTSLPGCSVGDSFYPNGIDCAIAKVVNGMPPECESDPQARTCILNMFPAFCGDLPSIRAGSKAFDTDIEYCLRRVALGPCVANPSGAACLSGQFAGIQFVVGGGNSSSLKRDASSDPLFGNQGQDLVPVEDQFWIGKRRYLVIRALLVSSFN